MSTYKCSQKFQKYVLIGRKSSDEGHYLDHSQAESESAKIVNSILWNSSKQESDKLSNEVLKMVEYEEVSTELSNEDSKEYCEEVSKADCQTLPKPTIKESLKYVSREKEPEKAKFQQKNTISKSSIEDLVVRLLYRVVKVLKIWGIQISHLGRRMHWFSCGGRRWRSTTSEFQWWNITW